MWWASALLAAPTISPRIVAPRPVGVLPLLEHEHGSALTHHEPVAADVERTRHARRRKRSHVAEAGQRRHRGGRLGAAGDDRVAAPPGDQPGGIADGVGTGGARRADRLVGSLQAVAHRDRRAAGVGHHHRDEEGRNPTLTLVDAYLDLLFECLQSADPGGEDRAETGRIDTDLAGGGHRLGGGGDGELLDPVGAARFFGVVVPR